jgi:hypothetical protein
MSFCNRYDVISETTEAFPTTYVKLHLKAIGNNQLSDISSTDKLFYFIFFMVRQPVMGQGLIIVASRSRSVDKPHSVGLLSTSDQPDAGTST